MPARRRAARCAFDERTHNAIPTWPQRARTAALGAAQRRRSPAMARTAAVARTPTTSLVGRLRGLSVILPCHDEAENVERAIDEATAAAELVADAHEILVVDDGSTRRHPRRGRAPAPQPTRACACSCTTATAATARRCRTGHRRRAAGVGLPHRRRPAVRRDRARALRAAGAVDHDIVAGYRIASRRPAAPARSTRAAWNRLVRRAVRRPRARRRLRVQAHAPRPRAGLPLARRRRDGRAPSSSPAPQHAGARIAELGVRHRPRVAGRASGANPRVVLGAFRELRAVRHELRAEPPRMRGDPRARPAAAHVSSERAPPPAAAAAARIPPRRPPRGPRVPAVARAVPEAAVLAGAAALRLAGARPRADRPLLRRGRAQHGHVVARVPGRGVRAGRGAWRSTSRALDLWLQVASTRLLGFDDVGAAAARGARRRRARSRR